MMRLVWPISLSILWICLNGPPCSAAEPAADADAAKFFETKIRPILADRCFECHGPKSKPEGNLRLDSLSGMLKGGDIGPAVKPGDPKGSLLIDAVNHGEIVQMPPKTKLPGQEIADLTAWVAQGAPWPDAPPAGAPATGSAAPLEISAEDREFWAFRPPQDPAIPTVHNPSWPQAAIDHFVLAPLEVRGLEPAQAATKRTLIRRATFDLHGLPPTPEEVERFVNDASPDAFAKVVDRLLASPRYGERWGRHWLDLARYADSNGMDENMAMAHAWRYRDYVVAAFNKDTPYDQFISEQIAGDLLPAADHETNVKRLIATGFLVLGPKMLAEDDPVKMEMDIIDEQVDTIGRAVMGLTLGCARCHDHKFDPISTRDYYSLAGIFKSTKSMENFRVVAMWSERSLGTPAQQAQLAAAEQEAARLSGAIKTLTDAANEKFLDDARGQLADYLLAATHREQQQRALADLTVAIKAGHLAEDSLLIEAEKYARGNVVRDFTTYGADIGVIYNAGEIPNVAEYDFELPAAGTYQLALRYAAAEARPVDVTLDGNKLTSHAATATTGSWTPESQTWSIEAVVPLSSGKHVIRLERSGPFPHIDKLALVPARFAKDLSNGSWHAIGQASEHRELNPVILEQWTRFLASTKEVPTSVMHVWHAWRQADEQGVAAQFDENNVVTAALLRAPRPGSLRELADRYAQLGREAESAWRAQNRPASLSDPTQEAFRQLLMSGDGPMALPKNADTFYAMETSDSLAALKKDLASTEQAKPVLPQALAVAEREPTNLRVHIRGSHLALGVETPRQFPRILAGDDQQPLSDKTSGRLELARWLTRPDHPLTSRVMVNRIWQGHFNEGLVRTSDNFGRLGERPDNQPLLDWLATRFVESGWSIKAMHRLIMLSSTYQMSTAYQAKAAEIDPENRLLWRMNRRRLEAEEIRDAILATSGQVDWAMGGTLLLNKNHTYVTSTASANDVNYENNRRSIYLPVVRSAVYEVLQAFDFADPSSMNGKRPSTTVAPQALFMMNGPIVQRESRAMAEQLLAHPEADDAPRVRLAYRRAYGREATDQEIERALNFVAQYQTQFTAGPIEAPEARTRSWQALCRVIFSSNEFIFLE